jgi:hypothetical protein
MPAAIAKQRDIEKKIQLLAKRLRPDVVSIKFTIKPDWSGDWGIFFQVMISDEAGEKRLREVTRNVERQLSEKFDFPSLGVFAYHEYRSPSEQAALNDPSWV